MLVDNFNGINFLLECVRRYLKDRNRFLKKFNGNKQMKTDTHFCKSVQEIVHVDCI